MIRPQTYPLTARQGKADRREIVVVKAYGVEERYRSTIHTTTLSQAVSVRLSDIEVQWHETPQEFWSSLSRYRSVLLIPISADRELAMLGHEPSGEGWKLLYDPIHNDPNRPRFYWAEWRRKQGVCRHIDIMQLANLHPEGVYASEVSLPDAVKWVNDWVTLLRNHDLGPKVEWTLARQALLSYRREADQHSRRLRWHTDTKLHRFEREVYNVQSPVRIAAEDGHFEKVYHLDFVAHYVSILATNPMPQECLSWLPEGCEPYVLEDALHRGIMALADITDAEGERHLLTTSGLLRTPASVVHRAAFYRPGLMLQAWAEKMYQLRSEAPAHIRPAVKGMAVSLWGRLAQRNHGFALDPDWEYQPGEEALYGQGNVLNHDTGALERFTHDGQRYVADPDAWRRERFPALGAHVLALGREALERLLAEVEPLYCHTDSIWSLRGVPATLGLGSGLGGIKIEIVRDVEWRDGVRYVNGKVDAQPGVARAGSRFYHRYDDAELLALPETAAWEVRE